MNNGKFNKNKAKINKIWWRILENNIKLHLLNETKGGVSVYAQYYGRENETEINYVLPGFIINNNYYHFNFNEINQGRNYVGIPQNQLTREQRRFLNMWNRQTQNVRNLSVPLLERVEGIESHQLSRIGPDYRHLLPESNNEINWNNIYNSFLYLTNN